MENISCQDSSLLTFCSKHKAEIGKMEEEKTWKTHMDSNTEEVEGREGWGGKKDEGGEGRGKELGDGEGRESRREMRRVEARRERRINNPQTFPSKRPCKPKYQNLKYIMKC